MTTLMARVRRRLTRRSGVGRSAATATVRSSLTADERSLVARCQPHTMATPERIIATADAVEHVVLRDIPGDLVECGVWRGGSVLAMILTLQRLGVDDRRIHLFDTFTGMTEPTDADTSPFDPPALPTFREAAANGRRAWEGVFGESSFNLAQVQALITDTGYPDDQVRYVVGPVEDTIPSQAPDRLAILRLDTDWYESTRHEMQHLYPRLSAGGVLLLDDYGHWHGARRAVDEYFEERGGRPLLARTDYTGRLAVKA